ncbi:hypothetical protein RI129_008424 [Pyrocoelia pectoralis]|uniref:Dehydrogenase/reductase SDR family member 4 n=1 Tax=Pyrocoelia pectoralis TaxID=417401 RepID=A0AAN7ZG11_9COLE
MMADTSTEQLYNNRLKGKVAIVTASTDGIGFATAKRFAQEGAKVVISSRHQKNVDRAISQLTKEGLGENVVGTVCHVAKADDRKRIFNEALKLGGPHILVSNAAVNPAMCHITECSESIWDKIFEVNVKASFLLAKEAHTYFQRNGGGRIIFMSSLAGYILSRLLGHYSVSKTALISLAKAIANDVASDNITVNCIAPGYIPTKFSNTAAKWEPLQRTVLTNIPLKRFGTTDDVAGVATFLASDDSSYITGETIVVGGGLASRL